jgi:hypothetical protein
MAVSERFEMLSDAIHYAPERATAKALNHPWVLVIEI